MDLNPAHITTLLITLKVASCATVLVGMCALPLAWLMARHSFRGRWVLEGVMLTPLILPPTVIGFFLLQLISDEGPLGIIWRSLVGDSLIFTQKAAIVAGAIVSFPLMYRSAKGAFEQIDPLALDAARSLGARPWYLFRTIGLEQAFPGLLGGITLAFGRALGEFGATIIVAGNIQGQTQTVSLAIYSALESGNTSEAGVWACVLGGLALGLGTLGHRFSTKK